MGTIGQGPARPLSAPVGIQDPFYGPACCAAIPTAGNPTPAPAAAAPADAHYANPAYANVDNHDEHPHAGDAPTYLPANTPNGVPMNVHIAG